MAASLRARPELDKTSRPGAANASMNAEPEQRAVILSRRWMVSSGMGRDHNKMAIVGCHSVVAAKGEPAGTTHAGNLARGAS